MDGRPDSPIAILGIDPGTAKAGFAVITGDGAVITAGILPIGELRDRLQAIVGELPIAAVALGRGTNSVELGSQLQALGLPIRLIDEHETTRRARELYFSEHPPRGWKRLIPIGLQVPPRPVDDYAAILIARRFLARESGREPQKVKPPQGAADR